MNIIKLNTITISLFLFGLTACQKQDTTIATPDEVQISITSPQEGSIYKKGDTVSIDANINSSTQLHGYIVRITNIGTNNVLFETEGHAHDEHLTIHEQWINGLSTATDLQLELIGVIDHDKNLKNIKIGFKSQP